MTVREVANLEQWKDLEPEAHRRAIPVKMPGLLSSFFSEKLTPEYFASLYPDIDLTVAIQLPKSGVPYYCAGDLHYRKMKMREFIELLESGAPCYLSQFPAQRFPGIVRYLHPSAVNVQAMKAINFWIGGVTRSGLHFDYGDNLFGQAYGRKRVLLVDPKHSRYLYQFPDVPSKSRVDPEHLDLERFPRFAKCEIISCELDAGDMLFIPRGWWHFVAADGISISINCWHGNSLRRSDFAKYYLAAGPQVAIYWLRDFIWYGLLGKEYTRRLFSPPSLGLESFVRMKTLLASRRADTHGITGKKVA